MAKHTPGPWVIDHRLSEDRSGYVAINGHEHSELAEVVWKMDDDERSPDCEANARLIAAAPDLLAALKYMECTFSQFSNEPAMTAARAAIAKAKGEN